jgi:hypothetical protein
MMSTTSLKAGLQAQWLQVRARLQARNLLAAPAASLSLRIPGTDLMWLGGATDAAPQPVAWRGVAPATADIAAPAALHAAVYRARPDAGAIAAGGGTYGHGLADFGGAMPQVFDEQARHLGPMAPPVQDAADLVRALHGGGNVLLVQRRPVCLGTTAARMVLNAELFEKCATAYVLAAAAGGPVRPLPWLVRAIANRRLHKDARRARQRFQQGLLPEESRGY